MRNAPARRRDVRFLLVFFARFIVFFPFYTHRYIHSLTILYENLYSKYTIPCTCKASEMDCIIYRHFVLCVYVSFFTYQHINRVAFAPPLLLIYATCALFVYSCIYVCLLVVTGRHSGALTSPPSTSTSLSFPLYMSLSL